MTGFKRPSSGSVVVGVIWTLFSSIFLIFGLWMLGTALVRSTWEKTPCVIERFEIAADQKAEPPFHPDLHYRYTWEGREYTGTKLKHDDKGGGDDYEDLADTLETLRAKSGGTALAGLATECRVNPRNPAEATLLPQGLSGWFGLLPTLAGALFVLIGITITRSKHKAQETQPIEGKAGAVIGVLFFSLFALAGFGVFGGVVAPALQRKFASRNWAETPATVIWSRVTSHRGSDDTTYKIDVFYRYTFEGREYRSNRYGLATGNDNINVDSKRDIVKAHPPGSSLTCFVNPEKPWVAVVDRKLGAEAWIMLFPIPFILVGTGGLFAMWWFPRRKKREEARAAKLAASALNRDKAVLETGRDRILGLLGLCAATIFWNSITGVFVSIAISSWLVGKPEKFLTIFIIPFVLVGIGLCLAALNRLLQIRNAAYEIEITPATLAPGSDASLHWRRGSGGNPRRLTFRLIAMRVSSDNGNNRSKPEHNHLIGEIVSPGERSHQALGFKIPVLPENNRHSLEWKIRVLVKSGWLPAVKEDVVIPMRQERQGH